MSELEHVLERFETSPRFKPFSFENEWINHPDEYYVAPNVFKNVFHNFFGNITLHQFLSTYSFDDKDNVGLLQDFRNSVYLLHSKLSYNEVECAHNQMTTLCSWLNDCPSL